MASGELSDIQYQVFLDRVLKVVADVCVDGCIVYACIDWRHLRQLLQAGAPPSRSSRTYAFG
jgi:hypothetical protein